MSSKLETYLAAQEPEAVEAFHAHIDAGTPTPWLVDVLARNGCLVSESTLKSYRRARKAAARVTA